MNIFWKVKFGVERDKYIWFQIIDRLNVKKDNDDSKTNSNLFQRFGSDELVLHFGD
jgi:hypothetical protein